MQTRLCSHLKIFYNLLFFIEKFFHEWRMKDCEAKTCSDKLTLKNFRNIDIIAM